VLVWRFSRKVKLGEVELGECDWNTRPSKEKVSGLKRFFEDMAGYGTAKTAI
jgi:hypothetical protein